MEFTDILYDVSDSVATISINRPHVLNAFTAHTVEELTRSFMLAWSDRSVRAVILTGTGDKAFCVGGDLNTRSKDGYAGQARSPIGTDIEALHSIIRDIPKPVIAAVNGFAIGGGHVLHVVCDMTIASDRARFGQVGPKVGSVDAGFGTGYLARIVGEKKAREIWFLCRQYSAEDARQKELVNAGEPQETPTHDA